MDTNHCVDPLKVYLVDPAMPVRRRLTTLLNAVPGIRVVGEADDAATALDEIASCEADVVLTELRLASGHGLDLIADLRGRVPRVTTIVLTNLPGAAFRTACLAAGAEYFFDKTVDFDAACETVGHLARVYETTPRMNRDFSWSCPC
jgi:DNA-binding NarL/FixJ family response regulator